MKVKSIFTILLVLIFNVSYMCTSYANMSSKSLKNLFIGSEIELNWFLKSSDTNNCQVYLTKDIDCTLIKRDVIKKTFNGAFHGNGHVIKNLKGPLCDINNGIIENVKFEKIGKWKMSDVMCVCRENNGCINCCEVKSSYVELDTDHLREMGGCLCLVNNKSAQITDCVINTDTTVMASRSNMYIAGICGLNFGKIQRCVNNGVFYGSAVGKITVYNGNRSLIKNCMFLGRICCA